MKFLVGLGNPGREHFRNRHNLGFLLIDAWAKSHKAEFNRQEFRSDIAKMKIGDEDVLVMKPLTFMNRSGDAVGEALAFYKGELKDVIVVHDELDIPPCTFRIKRGGGPGGHNGIRSILHMGDEFLRIRLGIGRPPHPDHQIADFVLGNLSGEEWDFWEKNVKQVVEAIDLCLVGKENEAMNRFHRKG